MVQAKVFVVIVGLLAFMGSPGAAESPYGQLVVFENPGCGTCLLFEKEIGKAYPRTELGQELPLVRVNTFSVPEEWTPLAQTVCFTPTFLILDREGQVRGRWIGYRGDEFFWSNLEKEVALLRREQRRGESVLAR
ncbi:MAG: hypothetical protein HQL56_00185 [Magnetococcales bacterium]|nr:hypothetical protein [Magnetococcales bacterium]